MRHDPERRGRGEHGRPRSGSGGRAERSPVAPCGWRVSQPGRPAAPLGRAALPAPYCPPHHDRVPFRGGPRRLRAFGEAFPAPCRPSSRGAWGRLPEKQSRDPGRQARAGGAQAGSTIPPACSTGAGAGNCRGAAGLCHPGPALTLLTLPPPAPAWWRIPESAQSLRTAAQARGKLRLYCSLPGAAIQTDPVLQRGRPWRGNSGLLLV